MKKRGRLLVVLSIIGIFSYMVLPVVNAETFDIGTKIAESDPNSGGYRWYYFDSGCMIQTKPDYIDHVILIFDGNLNTGINHSFGLGNDTMKIWLVIPYYITNLTFKPVFGGNASKYKYNTSNLLIYIGNEDNWFTLPQYVEETIQINGKIDSMRIWLDSNGTNHFYFNDVIINYTPSASNFDELQIQINDLTQQFNLLNTRINNLNNSITELNLTQDEILENITNLLATYNQLNESFVSFIDEFENLDPRFLQLESENAALKLEVTNLKMEIENLTQEIEKLKDDQDEPDDSVVFGAYILGILGIILALVAIILISKKSGPRQTPPEKEESKDSITPEKNDK